MFVTMFWFFVVIYGVAFAILSSLAAGRKHRDPVGWFIIGLLFGIFGLAAALIVSPLQTPEELSSYSAHGTPPGSAKCPFCAEAIKQEARVCRYCGRDLPADWAARQLQAGKNQALEQAAQAAAQASEKRRALEEKAGLELCARLRKGGLDYREYQQLAHAAGATLGLSNGSVFAKYVVTNDGNDVVIKRFKDLKPWFLENVVPQVESKA